MSLERFVSANEPTWVELGHLIDAAGTRPATLGDERLLRLGALYRSAAADLAQARRQFPDEAVVGRLESLVVRARALVYARGRRGGGIARFYTTDYWRLLVERRAILATALALLLVPTAFGAALATVQPDYARTILPEGFLWVTEPQAAGTDQGFTGGELALFSTFILTNNIRVTLMAFALGITFGLGTAASVVFNGLVLGAVGGLAVGVGNSALLVEAVAAHGILELSCIVAGATAGLRMASGLVRPGHRPRRLALVEEAKPAGLLALGTAPFLILAGFVEGYVSRTGTTAGPAVVIGLILGGGYWALAAFRGASGGDQTRAAALARR